MEDAQAVALVFIGDESGGQSGEGESCEHDAHRQSTKNQLAQGDHPGEQGGVGPLQALKAGVERREDLGQVGPGQGANAHTGQVGPAAEGCGAEAPEGQPHDHAHHDPGSTARFGGCLPGQDQAREHRRETKGVEGRDGDREGDRQRKLLVDDSDASGVEGHRHEHRHQHQCRSQEGPEQFAHAGQSRLAGFHPLLDVGGHRLDHHDGIVHHQACGQDQPQQGELVDRETEQLEEGEAADQRDRDGQAWHDRGAPVLQEQKQDHQHQHDGQAQGINYPIHRRLDELPDVINLVHRHPRWHEGAELIELFHHRIGHIEGVARGGLIHRQRQRFMAVLVDALHREAVGAVAHFAHVLELEQVARG